MAQSRSVVSNEYPYLPVRLEVQGQSKKVLALLDTGYTGSVIIPAQDSLGRPDGRTTIEVGDGRTVFAPVYLGIIEIGNLDTLYGVAITALGDEYILGRNILERYEITLDHSKRVIVKP